MESRSRPDMASGVVNKFKADKNIKKQKIVQNFQNKSASPQKNTETLPTGSSPNPSSNKYAGNQFDDIVAHDNIYYEENSSDACTNPRQFDDSTTNINKTIKNFEIEAQECGYDSNFSIPKKR